MYVFRTGTSHATRDGLGVRMDGGDEQIRHLSETIGAVYDAAVEPGLWPQALELTAALIGGRTASIGISDTVTHETLIRTTWGVEEPYISNYAEYVASMPFYQLYAAMGVEEAKAGSAMYDMDDFHASRFYKEWAGPQGLEDVAALCIMNDSRRFGIFGVNVGNDRDLVGPRDLEKLRLLAPHVRRAATISDLLDVTALAASRANAALDAVGTGIMLVGDDMKVQHANRAAQSILDAREGLSYSGGRLSLTWAKASDALDTAVARAAKSDVAMERSGFSLPAPRDKGAALVLHVLPVAHSRTRRDLAPNATAAVFLSSAASVPTAPVDALAALYDLSRAEASTLTHIGGGRTRQETATLLGVSVSTIKTHLLSVFRKTGTSRQPELVRLASSLALALDPR
jgi:DNA-binding CsgD family transcriptional regulator